MKTIKLNSKTEINLTKLIDSRLLVQANSGGGKSWLLRRLLEQSHGKVQQIILDPEGEFGTLREKYDYVLAGKGGDTPAEPRSAALLAHKLLELGVSAIIDLYELPPQDRKRFVRLFLEALVDAPKELWHPVIVVLDEAHVFAPEKDVSEASSAVKDLATRGRKRGYCAVLATQRISKLAKDAAAECNNKLIGRSSIDIDMKRAGYELGFTKQEQLLSLRALKPGEFYAFGPAISDEVIRVDVGDVQTTHPKAGSRTLTKVVPPTVSIKKILGKLADLPVEAEKEAKTIAEMKSEIKELKRKLHPNNQPKQIDPRAVERIVLLANKKAGEEWENIVKKWVTYANNLKKSVSNIIPSVGKEPLTTPRGWMTPSNLQSYGKEIPVSSSVSKKHYENAFIKKELFFKEEGEHGLGICAKKIYSFLHENSDRGFTKVQLGAVTGYSSRSGGFNNAIARLNSLGLIKKRGDEIFFGEKDEQHIIESEQYSPELWFSKLGACEKKIYRILWDNPDIIYSKEDIGEQTGYSPTSGGFNNAISHLNAIGLLRREGGGIVLNPELTKL